MNLDDLRKSWLQKSSALDGWQPVDRAALRAALEQRAARELRRLGPLASFELWVWAPCVLFFGWFCWTEPLAHLRLAGLAPLLWCIAMPLWSMAQRRALRALPLSLPVVELQQRIEALALRRLHAFKWAFLVGQVVWWVPSMMLFFRIVFGVDVVARAPYTLTLLGYSVAFSLLAVPVLALLERFAPASWRARTPLRQLAWALAGRDIRAARAFLAELQALEREGGQPATRRNSA